MPTVDITGRLARHMAEARKQSLAPYVAREARHRIKERVQLVADPALMDPAAPRSGLVEVVNPSRDPIPIPL